ncbi:hypothetical protein KI387_025949, partial [Taxus chinensis]
GKAKPLKQPKQDKKEYDEHDLANIQKKKDEEKVLIPKARGDWSPLHFHRMRGWNRKSQFGRRRAHVTMKNRGVKLDCVDEKNVVVENISPITKESQPSVEVRQNDDVTTNGAN